MWNQVNGCNLPKIKDSFVTECWLLSSQDNIEILPEANSKFEFNSHVDKKTKMTETAKGLSNPELSDLFEAKVRVSSPSTASEVSEAAEVVMEDKARKNRSDSGCSYETNEDAAKKANNSGNSTDSGHGSSELEEGMIYSYHFKIPSHLCGKYFILL